MPEVSETILFSFYSLFFILLCFSYFYHFFFQLTYPLFCFNYSVFIPSNIFLILVIVLFIVDCLFFNSPSFLLNIYCIFSICVSILLLRFWIIFTIITLFFFSDRSAISSTFICSYGFLSCPLVCIYFPVISFCLTFYFLVCFTQTAIS